MPITKKIVAAVLAGSISLVGFPVAASAGESASDDQDVTFTFDRVVSAIDGDNATSRRSGSTDLTSSDLGIYSLELDRTWAVVDASLVSAGAGVTAAATNEFVDVAWSQVEDASQYNVLIDGDLVAEVQGTAYRYHFSSRAQVTHVQVIPTNDDPTTQFPIYGLMVRPPAASDQGAVVGAVETTTTALKTYNSATLYWRSFIPEARVDAPLVGCSYGSGYEFGGDDRGYSMDDTASSKTRMERNITWDTPVWSEQGNVVGTTHVYNKATGDLVDYATAVDTVSRSYLLGTDATTSQPGTYADIRMSLQTANPFCGGNSIEGAFTITMHRSGSYVIPSGSHRQMPNHEVYVSAWTWDTGPIGEVVNPQEYRSMIYQRDYLDPLCLVNLACPPAYMSGYAGSY